MKREQGYYWVKWNRLGREVWMVGYWTGRTWHLVGFNDSYPESYFLNIREEKLLEPPEGVIIQSENLENLFDYDEVPVYGTKEGKLYIRPEDLFALPKVQKLISKIANSPRVTVTAIAKKQP